jgi:predicted DNA-binding transcriptional regulator YafY
MEISPLIKKWMPNLEILEPKEWREKLSKELTQYLETMTNAVK